LSQSGTFLPPGGTPGVVDFLQGNSGGPVGPNISNTINVVGSGDISVTGNPGTNTLTISQSGIVATEYIEDSGTAIPALGILNVIGGESVGGLAININTIGSGSTVEVCLNNSISLPDTNSAGTAGVIFINGVKFLHKYGAASNTFVGGGAGNFTLTAGVATFNTGLGATALSALTTGADNCAAGTGSGRLITTGSNNSSYGDGSLGALTTGSNNIALGYNAGINYTTLESSNLVIGNSGVTLENNTMRIGVTGSGTGQQARCFIAGINAVNVGSVASVVAISGDQLGLTTITAGTGISVTAGANIITIANIGAGFTWFDVTGGSATLAAESGYIADAAGLTTFTMPTNNAFGDTIKIVGKGAGGWKIVYSANQNIIFGSSTSTTTTGNISSTNAHDCLEMVCTTASATQPIFTVVNSIGNPSIT
jgi:hypothetical protein